MSTSMNEPSGMGKKKWTDPQLIRLDRPIGDATRTGDISGGTEGMPTTFSMGFLIYSGTS